MDVELKDYEQRIISVRQAIDEHRVKISELGDKRREYELKLMNMNEGTDYGQTEQAKLLINYLLKSSTKVQNPRRCSCIIKVLKWFLQ